MFYAHAPQALEGLCFALRFYIGMKSSVLSLMSPKPSLEKIAYLSKNAFITP